MKQALIPYIVSVGIYNSQISVKNKELTNIRKTTMFEIELPICKGGVSYIDEESAPISKSMIICAKPGQFRKTMLPFKCYYVHMIVADEEIRSRLMQLPNYIKPENIEEYENIFVKMSRAYATGLDIDRMLVQSLIFKLIHMLCKHSVKDTFVSQSSNKEMIEKVISYIRENLNTNLSLQTLSEYASFSPIHFHNCFKRSTGKTLREFVEEQRIQKAVNLLISTDKTLAQIGDECGFSSQAYFSFVFKRKMKITPREYVRELYMKE